MFNNDDDADAPKRGRTRREVIYRAYHPCMDIELEILQQKSLQMTASYDDDAADTPKGWLTRDEVYRKYQPRMVIELSILQRKLLSQPTAGNVRSYFRGGDSKSCEKMIQNCNEIIRLNPHDAQAYSARAIANSYLGNHDRAIQDCNKAICLNPSSAAIYCDLGFAKCQLKDYEGAIQDCNEAVRLNPNGCIEYSDRSEIRNHIAEHDQSLTLDKQVDLFEKAKDDIETYLKKSDRLDTYSNQKARDTVLEPLSIKLNTHKNSQTQRDQHIKKAFKYIETNDYAAASTEYDNAIPLDPNNTLLINSKKVSTLLTTARQFEQTDLAQAIQYAEQAMAVGQSYLSITNSLLIDIRKKHRQTALARYQANEWEQSIVLFNQIMTDRPADIDILSKRGITYLKLDNIDAASKDIKTILSHSRSLSKAQKIHLVQILNKRAKYYRNLKQYDAAIKDYDLILQFDPFNKHAKKILQQLLGELFHVKPDKISEKSRLLLYGHIEFPRVLEQLLRPLGVRWRCHFDGQKKRLAIISNDIMFKVSLKYFFESHLNLQIIESFSAPKELDIGMDYQYKISLNFGSLSLEELEDKITELTEIMREPTRIIHILSGYIELINIGCAPLGSWTGRFFTMGTAERSKISWIEQAQNRLIAEMRHYKTQHRSMIQTIEQLWQLKVKHQQLAQLLEQENTVQYTKMIVKLTTKLEAIKQQLVTKQNQLKRATQRITESLEYYGKRKGGYYLGIDQCGFGKYERALEGYRQAKTQAEAAEKKSQANSENTGLTKRLNQTNRRKEQQEKILQRAYANMQAVWQQKKAKYDPTQLLQFQELHQMDIDKAWWKINVIDPAIRIAFTKVILDLQKPYRYKIGFKRQEEYEQLIEYIYEQIKQSDYFTRVTCTQEAENLIGNLALWVRSQLLPIQPKSRYFELNIIKDQLTIDNPELKASIEPFLGTNCLNKNGGDDTWWKEKQLEQNGKSTESEKEQEREQAKKANCEAWYEKYRDQEVIWYILSNRNEKRIQGNELLLFLLRPSNLEERPTTKAEWILISCLTHILKERLQLLEVEKEENQSSEGEGKDEYINYDASAPPLTEENRSEQTSQSMQSIMSLPTHYSATAPPFSDETSSIILNLAAQFYYPSLSDIGSVIPTAPPLSGSSSIIPTAPPLSGSSSIIPTAPPLSGSSSIIPTAPPKTESSEKESGSIFNSPYMPYMFFSFQEIPSRTEKDINVHSSALDR